MTITVFTSNQPRHIALIESLSGIAATVFAVQETTTIFPGQVPDFYRKSEVMQRYFARVIDAERQVFGSTRFLPGNVRSLSMRMGDLSLMSLDAMSDALRADLFVVFGASYIKGPLCQALVDRRAINIHMGASPFYRGSSTNFWALYDRHPEYVGATLHRLTSGLDSGPILRHAFPPTRAVDPFLLGMLAVQSAQRALIDSISDGTIDQLTPVPQDRSVEMRYTRNADFTDAVAEEYLARLPSPNVILNSLGRRPQDHLVRPYIPCD